MKYKLIKFLGFLVSIISLVLSYDFENVERFSTPYHIKHIAETDGFVWATTPAGLVRYDKKTEELTLIDNVKDFKYQPTGVLTSDISGNLWVAAQNGVLYKITPDMDVEQYSEYYSAGWTINAMVAYRNTILIASSNGFSIFDARNGKILQSTNSVGLSSPYITTVSVVKKSDGTEYIYLGTNEGVVFTEVTGRKFESLNLFATTIWNFKASGHSIKAILSHADRAIISSHDIAVYDGSVIYPDNNGTHFYSETYFTHTDTLGICEFDSISHTDTVPIFSLSKPYTAIYVSKDGEFWTGSENNGLLRYLSDGNKRNYTISGLLFTHTNKIEISSDGSLWILPATFRNPNNNKKIYDNLSLMRYSNGNWTFFEHNKNNFGSMGDGFDFWGAAEDREHNMWFGTNGASVKKFYPAENRWVRYQMISGNSDVFKKLDENDKGIWGKCDAIASDSSGFMWFGNYGNQNRGSLLCVKSSIDDPDSTDYRVFFPVGNPAFLGENVYRISVDSHGNVLAGADRGGAFIVFKPDSIDPVKNGVNTPHVIENLGSVSDITSDSYGRSWVTSSDGLYLYDGTMNNFSFLKVEKIPNPALLVSVACESRMVGDVEENNPYDYSLSVWLGYNGDGLLKSVIDVTEDSTGNIASAKYNAENSRYYTVDDGLISNNITTLKMDNKTGTLYASSDLGFTKIVLGYTVTLETDTRNISVYPNPVIISKNPAVTFTNVVANGYVLIYDISGKLITRVTNNNSDVLKNSNSWTYIWRPGKLLLPGTYIYVGKGDRTGNSKFKTGYGKLLFLP